MDFSVYLGMMVADVPRDSGDGGVVRAAALSTAGAAAVRGAARAGDDHDPDGSFHPGVRPLHQLHRLLLQQLRGLHPAANLLPEALLAHVDPWGEGRQLLYHRLRPPGRRHQQRHQHAEHHRDPLQEIRITYSSCKANRATLNFTYLHAFFFFDV